MRALRHVSRIARLIRASPLTYRRRPEACARVTCDRRDQSVHKLAPLATPSSTNAFTCVYINVIAAGSNSFFRGSPVPSCLARRYWVITSRTLSSRHLHDILARREHLLTMPYVHTHPPTRETPMRGAINAPTDVHTHTRARRGRSPSHLSTERRQQTLARTRTRCRTPSAHEETRNRSCRPGGTRFTDPSCERRYRYLHRPISSGRLIGSAREYLGPAIGPREKAFGACTLCDRCGDSPTAYMIQELLKIHAATEANADLHRSPSSNCFREFVSLKP